MRGMHGVRRIIRPSRRRARDQRGLVIVYFAMTLIVLMIASAFVVDLGAWYARAQEIQKAADAAAMAGVSYLPGDPTSAVNTAIATAAKNGFVDGANGGTIHVTAATVPGESRQLRVDIKDDKVAQYFSKAFYSGTSESRHGTAEYLAALELGSPENGFGMGNLYNPSQSGNFWAAVDGYCNAREQGDLKLAHSDGEYISGAWDCSASTSDTYASSYDPTGYTYQVEVPSGHPQLIIEAYDPAFVPFYFSPFVKTKTCPNGGTAIDPDIAPVTTHYSVTTSFVVTKPDGTSVTKTYASTEQGGGSGLSHGASTYCNVWDTLLTIQPCDPAGIYEVYV